MHFQIAVYYNFITLCSNNKNIMILICVTGKLVCVQPIEKAVIWSNFLDNEQNTENIKN
jgi:hypothetical protein